MTKPWKRWGPGKPVQVPTLTSIEAYARWADAYPARAHNALMRAEEAAVYRLLPDLRGREVLDMACGTGRWGQFAQEAGASRVIALDNSPEMLTRCALRERALASLEAIPLAPQSVDVIVCGLAAGHIPFLDEPLKQLALVLRPGGVAVFSDFHPYLALSGAQRTFTDTEGRRWAIEHNVHLVSDWLRAGSAAGLLLTGLEEPGLLDEDATASNPGGVPVVLALRFERPA
jgi:malonyl-CoA O-methyltransferase